MSHGHQWPLENPIHDLNRIRPCPLAANLPNATPFPPSRLLVLEEALPRLNQAAAVAPPEGQAAGGSLGETALRLKQHYHRLRVRHAVWTHGHLGDVVSRHIMPA